MRRHLTRTPKWDAAIWHNMLAAIAAIRRGKQIVRIAQIARIGRSVLMGLLVLALLPLEAGAKSSKEKGKNKDRDKDKKESKGIDLPLPPVGHDGKGVNVPDRDPDGKLRMMFHIGTAFRVDERHLKMDDLKIETYNDAGKVDMFIEMPASLFDLETRIITSVDPVKIHRFDFEVTGSNMTFNTQTREGKFTGPVRMLIFDSNDLEKTEKEEPK